MASNVIYVNVSGTWKQATDFYVNVSGTWKTGTQFAANISNTWTGDEAPSGGGFPSAAVVLGLDLVDFTLPTFGVLDAKTAVDSTSLDLVDFTLPTFGQDLS